MKKLFSSKVHTINNNNNEPNFTLDEETRCTFKQTGPMGTKQYFARCLDCFSEENEGACENCIRTCHKGHNVSRLRLSEEFFCDCGAKNMCGEFKNKRQKMMNCVGLALHSCQCSNTLGFKLFDVMTEKSNICSPFSISFLLAMLHHGSTGITNSQLTKCFNGKSTMEQLVAVYELFNSNIIQLANMVLVNQSYPVNPNYIKEIGALALVSNENFANSGYVVAKANNFIEQNTHGLIKNIVQPEHVSLDMIMILINTIYFKANWANKFSKHLTEEKLFNNTIKIPMMHDTETFPYFENNKMQLLEMPYAGNQFCMGFVLPKKNASWPTASELFNYVSTQKEMEKIKVSIPKFTQRKNMDPIPFLKQLGITSLFSTNANLEGICDDAYISEMIHEAVVIVDEEGTEAAAVTMAAMTFETCRREPEPIIFTADHSFVYYIKHNATGAILFIGDYHGI